MSDQTPNSSETLEAGAEPSMEDILASIRKIISEDEPVALASPEDDFAAMDSPSLDLVSDAVGDTTDFTAQSVDLDVEAKLAELAEVEMTPPTAPLEIEMPAATADTSTDVDDEDILAMFDMDIPVEADDAAAFAVTEAVSSDATNFSTPASEVSEMDSLLDDILASPESITVSAPDISTAESVEQPEAKLSDDDIMSMLEPVSPSVETDPDLDLVKSLMADLADTPADEVEDLDALLSIPEAEPEGIDTEVPEAAEAEAEDVSAFVDEGMFEPAPLDAEPAQAEPVAVAEAEEAFASEDDILSDILDMTLEDELQVQPDDIMPDDVMPSADIVAADELANLSENAPDEALSLSAIAAAADADASALAAPNPIAATVGLTATGAGLAALGATALGAEPAEAPTQPAIAAARPKDLSDVSQLDTSTEQTDIPSPQQEPDMNVTALNSDAILDEVTESATAGAFASLNQVVEEKATFNERGPRIGDLVQDALRPMLKEWLDANLKGIVERAVTKEVKRISSGK